MITAVRRKWLGLAEQVTSHPLYVFIILIVASFLAIRVPLLDYNRGEIPDSWEYLFDADGLLRAGPSFYLRHENERLPTFPLLIAIGLPFFPEGLHWARFVALLCSGGSIWLTTKLYGVLFPNQSGRLLVPLLMLLHPLYTLISIRPLSENILLFFTLASFFVYYNPTQRFRPLLLGLTAGLAALSRGEGFLVFAILIAASLWQRRWRDLLLPLAAFVFVIGPYLVRNLLQFGNPFYPYGVPVASELVEVSTETKALRGLLYSLTTSGLRLLYILAFLPALFWVAKGLSVAVKSARWRLLPLGAYLAAMWSLLIFWRVVVHVQRYYLFNVPFLAMLLALSLSQRADWVRSRAAKARLTIGTLLLVLVYTAGIRFAHLNKAFYQTLQIHEYFLDGTLHTLQIVAVSSLVPLWLAPRFLSEARYRACTVALILVGYALITPRVLGIERLREHRSVQDAARFAASLKGKVAYGTDDPAVHWYLRKQGVYLPVAWTLGDEEQWAWVVQANVDYLLWSSDTPRKVTEAQARQTFAFAKKAPYWDRLELVRRFIGLRGEQWDIVCAQDKGEGVFIPLSRVGQTFAVADQATVALHEIVLLMEKDKWAADEVVTLTLWDALEKNRLLGTLSIAGKEITKSGNADAWAVQPFAFPEPIPVTPGNRYYFELTSEHAQSALTIYQGLADLYPGGSCYISGLAQPQDLWFKVHGAFRGRSELYRVKQ